MNRAYRVKPVKHKHHKPEDTHSSQNAPVLTRKISGKLKVQEDILARAPILTCYGKYRICIENYRCILEYRDDQVRVQTKTGKITIAGQHLTIAYYMDESMCVLGEIASVTF